MNSLPLPGNPRLARLGTALGLLLIAGGLRAADPAYQQIPDAPTVPTAPSLPDAAVVNQPLQPSVGQEIIEERPSYQHVWISGHYRWADSRYTWVAGRWEVPPRSNLSWVEPRWDRKGNGYVLAGGYWQEASYATPSYAQAPAPVATPTTPPPSPQSYPAQPAPAPVVIINEPPPPPQQEYIVEQPSPYHVWVGGYWGYRGGRRVWVGGHWDLPPRTNVVWVEPRWERRGNGYAFVEGYWQDATPGRVSVSIGIGGGRDSIILREPPPPRREVIPARPPPGMVWVGGYWSWHGDRHLWVAGHFERPPRSRAVWVEPRWEHRGNGYVFVEGSWR